MDKTRTIVCPQIRYHISYDKNLSLKDLEDLINLIRISNNDALYEMGVSRAQGNDLQKIDKIEPGSIEIILAIIEVLSDCIDIGKFIRNSAQIIADKIKFRRERPRRSPREDRKVYEKYEVIIEIKEAPPSCNDTTTTYVIHIHICNARDDL